jgi:hypothetical protein
MSMQYRLPDKVVVDAGPWTFYCAVCSETMRIKTLAPSQGGMKTRTYRCSYECACGHSSPSLTGSTTVAASRTSTISLQQLQRTPVTLTCWLDAVREA